MFATWALRVANRTLTSLSKGPGTYPLYGTRDVHRADIYSLGCLLIELYGQRRVWPNMDGWMVQTDMLQVLGFYETAP